MSTSQTEPVDLGAVADFPPGCVRAVRAAGRALVVVNHAGELAVLRDQCPHQGAALSAGQLRLMPCARLVDGVPVFTADEPALQCPWHGWAFRLDDGCSTFQPDQVRVRRYPTRVQQGRLLVSL